MTLINYINTPSQMRWNAFSFLQPKLMQQLHAWKGSWPLQMSMDFLSLPVRSLKALSVFFFQFISLIKATISTTGGPAQSGADSAASGAALAQCEQVWGSEKELLRLSPSVFFAFKQSKFSKPPRFTQMHAHHQVLFFYLSAKNRKTNLKNVEKWSVKKHFYNNETLCSL